MSGFKKNPRPHKEKKPLSHGWIVVPSKTYPDRVYFYNTVTKCSTWSNPCEDAFSRDYGSSSSEASSVERKRFYKTQGKFSKTSQAKKQNSKIISSSPDYNFNIRINKEIEDYDEQQDQYFDNVPINAFNSSYSEFHSPLSSPDSESSSKINISDSESNLLLEDKEKELWVHFVSSVKKPNVKKSVALSDFDEPSTSKRLELEMAQESGKNNSPLRDFSKEEEPLFFENDHCNKTSKKDVLNLKKRKAKKKRKEHLSRNVVEKTFKNISFKVRDKTPAQTRLLKLRKQNAEKLKELVGDSPNLIFPKKSNPDNTCFNFEEETQNNSFSDAYLERIELCSSSLQAANHSKGEFFEEMDWEPSSEESDVRNINMFRQQVDKGSESSSDIFFGINLDNSSILPPEKQAHSLFLVLDTNIFVSCLSFVKELRDTKISDLGYPIIYVPWRVLQELDHLKDTKIDTVDKNLHVNVRKAITYLNDNFKSRHPRIYGQSFEDFAKMVDVEVFAPDDEILQTCIQFQKLHTNKQLILLTNDKNLESKAIISRVEVYSKDRFQKKYLCNPVPPACSSALNSVANKKLKIDDCLCEVKAALKDFISSVVETEMKIAFEGDWIKLAFKKPPFSLQDALDCLLKHWRAVFFLNFSKETHFDAEKLYEKLFKKEAGTPDDVIEIIKTSQRLILSIKRSQKKKRLYLDFIPAVMDKLSNLLEELSSSLSSKANDVVETSLHLAVPAINESLQSQQASQAEVSSNEVSKVKNLFKDIWDSLRNLCCSVTDVIHSSGASDEAVRQEIRLKLSQTLDEVQQLVTTVEKILNINPQEINNCHPLIIHFSNFLIRVYPAMTPELKNELPKSLAAFFTDFEGRCLLSSSLNDFKEFIQDLSKATKYFKLDFAC